jgi:hypothetical protein
MSEYDSFDAGVENARFKSDEKSEADRINEENQPDICMKYYPRRTYDAYTVFFKPAMVMREMIDLIKEDV